MDEEKIEVYHHPNTEIRSFLTQQAMAPPRVEHFKKPMGGGESENALKQLGIIGAQIVRDIMAIPGVREIRIKPKEIRMIKEEWCAWDEIEAKVIEILRSALRRKKIKMIKG